jgi:putative transcriptional regulator
MPKTSPPKSPPESTAGEYLQGKLLIAMPSMSDPRFERSVIYLCAHSAAGAMGLVINKRLSNVTFADLLKQLGLPAADAPTPAPKSPPRSAAKSTHVHFGGPVEPGRGFVLHSSDYRQDETLLVDTDVGLTATVEVLKAMAVGQGPKHSLVALGYAGWAPGQLDAEIQANGWLHAPADDSIVFGPDDEAKWPLAVRKVGIDPGMLSTDAGHA